MINLGLVAPAPGLTGGQSDEKTLVLVRFLKLRGFLFLTNKYVFRKSGNSSRSTKDHEVSAEVINHKKTAGGHP